MGEKKNTRPSLSLTLSSFFTLFLGIGDYHRRRHRFPSSSLPVSFIIPLFRSEASVERSPCLRDGGDVSPEGRESRCVNRKERQTTPLVFSSVFCSSGMSLEFSFERDFFFFSRRDAVDFARVFRKCLHRDGFACCLPRNRKVRERCCVGDDASGRFKGSGAPSIKGIASVFFLRESKSHHGSLRLPPSPFYLPGRNQIPC